MKRKLTSVLFVLLTVVSYAQDAPEMFAIFESQVKPSATAVYRDAVKKFVATCKQQNMSFSWSAGSLDDNTYLYIVPIKGFADLDKNMFADLEAKIGKDVLGGLWQGMDKCVDSQSSSIAVFMPGMSYLNPPPGEYFRSVLYWTPEPDKAAEAEKLIAEWNNLFKSKKAPGGVHTYKTIFGGEPGYVFVSWGKNKLDLATKDQKNNELFGEEAGKLWAKTMLITQKYYTRDGWVETELSYAPAPK